MTTPLQEASKRTIAELRARLNARGGATQQPHLPSISKLEPDPEAERRLEGLRARLFARGGVPLLERTQPTSTPEEQQRHQWKREQICRQVAERREQQERPEEESRLLRSGNDFPRRPQTRAPILTPGQERLWNALAKYRSLCEWVMGFQDPQMVGLFCFLRDLDKVPDAALELVAGQILDEQTEICEGRQPRLKTPPALEYFAKKCLTALNMAKELDELRKNYKPPLRRATL